MPVVTALRATRAGRIAVDIDGTFLCSVSEAFLARWRLYKGREFDDEALAELRASASREHVLGDALRLLGHRARSREELRRRLLQKEHDEAAVEAAVEHLEQDGLLDDAAFARSFAHDKRLLSGWGSERIRRDLKKLGVADDDIVAALAEPDGDAAEGEGEYGRALAYLRRKGGAREPSGTARQRAYGALQRRGFASEVAAAAIKQWLRDEPPGGGAGEDGELTL